MRLILAFIMGLLALSIADEAMSDTLRTFNASNVSDLIKKGQPANFDNCTIIDDLNLSALKIDKVVYFNNTIFQNSVNCNFTTFGKAAYFENSKFNRDAYFRSTEFNGDVVFWRSKFNRNVFFHSSKFNGTAHFDYSNFKDDAPLKIRLLKLCSI
jgi:hypothetical protein